MNGKSPDAFRTISEVADWLEVNTHVLRFWESKFSQVKPVKRAGGRRYYRRADMELLGGIQKLLHEDGMTIKGVQKILKDQGIKSVSEMSKPVDPEDTPEATVPAASIVATGTPLPETVVSESLERPLDSEPAETAEEELPGASTVPIDAPDSDISEPSPVQGAQATMAQVESEIGDTTPDPGLDNTEAAFVSETASPAPRPSEVMPLFSHHEAAPESETLPAPEAETRIETTAEQAPAEDAPAQERAAEVADDSFPTFAPSEGPIIAPLPTQDLSLSQALDRMQPMQISPESLAPIHARLIALRARMGAEG